MIRQSLRIEMKNTIDRLESQVEISTGQLAAFEKDVEKKANEADSVGKSSIAAQMNHTEIEEIEKVLHDVTQERERRRSKWRPRRG